MPAGRLFVCLALVTVALAAGVAVPGLTAAALVADAVLLAAFLIDRSRAAATPLEARREMPDLLVQHAEAEVSVEVENGAPRPVRIRLREGLDPGLAGGPLRCELELSPRGPSRWTYALRPPRRGLHTLAPLSARVLGPWGLAWSQRDLLGEETHAVYPQVRWGGRVGQLLALAQRRELGQAPLRFQGSGSELYAVREYLPGDPLSRIHWKSTARHGRLVAREDTWERGARLVILLDSARAMASADPQQAAGEGRRSKLDHALAAALALARLAHGRGDRVTLIAFAETVRRVVRVRPGAAGTRQAYRELFDLEARLTEPAFDLAADKVAELESRSATVVLFTSVVDLAAAELLRESLLRLERRHRPVLLNLEDPELVGLALGAPSGPEEAFAKVASLEIMLANRRLGRRLRRAGVRAVTTAADRLAVEALESYLAIFRARVA